jgi:hypothetical protein
VHIDAKHRHTTSMGRRIVRSSPRGGPRRSGRRTTRRRMLRPEGQPMTVLHRDDMVARPPPHRPRHAWTLPRPSEQNAAGRPGCAGLTVGAAPSVRAVATAGAGRQRKRLDRRGASPMAPEVATAAVLTALVGYHGGESLAGHRAGCVAGHDGGIAPRHAGSIDLSSVGAGDSRTPRPAPATIAPPTARARSASVATPAPDRFMDDGREIIAALVALEAHEDVASPAAGVTRTARAAGLAGHAVSTVGRSQGRTCRVSPRGPGSAVATRASRVARPAGGATGLDSKPRRVGRLDDRHQACPSVLNVIDEASTTRRFPRAKGRPNGP